jgi:putative hydrolase of the HAD superfamily
VTGERRGDEPCVSSQGLAHEAGASGGIRAVVFDFGGVLSSPISGAFVHVREAVGISAEALGQAMAAVTERDGVNPLHELECGRVSEAEFMADLGAVLSEQLDRPVGMHDFSATYFAHLETNHAMIDLARSVRERGLRTAMLTNNVREWEPRWRAMLPVDDLFELVVDSAFVGMRKPDPEIYALLLERLGLPASACLLVDDFAVNCEAAREAGMHAVRFVDTPQTIADVEALLRDVTLG